MREWKTVGAPLSAEELAEQERLKQAQDDFKNQWATAQVVMTAMSLKQSSNPPDTQCEGRETWTGEMVGYPPLRCLLEKGHTGTCQFKGDW